jgi:hypothetical protein
MKARVSTCVGSFVSLARQHSIPAAAMKERTEGEGWVLVSNEDDVKGDCES